MPKIGVPELIIILVIILVIFGAGRIPEIGGALGRGIRSFRKGLQDEPPSLKKGSEGKEKDEDKA